MEILEQEITIIYRDFRKITIDRNIDKKTVEMPTGVKTIIDAKLQGPILLIADGHLKAKWINFNKCFKPIEL